MKLPVIDSYAFPVILPSTKEPINVRPFLVKEEKILLLSQESNNPDMQVDAIAQVIKNCTFNAIDPRHAPYFDVEYLLLQIRSRSVGEVINPTYKCHTLIPELNTECGHLTNISINLSEIPPTNVDKTPKDFLVNINNRFVLKLKYPTIYTVNDLLLAATNSEFPTAEKTLNAIVDMFDTLLVKSQTLLVKSQTLLVKSQTLLVKSQTLLVKSQTLLVKSQTLLVKSQTLLVIRKHFL